MFYNSPVQISQLKRMSGTGLVEHFLSYRDLSLISGFKNTGTFSPFFSYWDNMLNITYNFEAMSSITS